MRVLMVANLDWYLYNYRLALAEAIRTEGHEVHLLGSEGEYLPRLRRLGFPCHSWKLSRQVSGPWRAVAEMRRLTGVIAKVRPDLVHYFTVKPMLYGALVRRWCRHSYAVVNAPAGLWSAFSAPGLRSRPARSLMRRWYGLACNGPGVENILQNPDDIQELQQWRALRASNFHLIRGSGVSLQRFTATARAPSDAVVVLMATRVNAFKGVREFVAAARYLRERELHVEFVLAGKPDRGLFGAIGEEEIAAWVEKKWIRYLGHREDMREVLQSSDVVVLPSQIREGVPRILIEAAAMGKPLVATDVPGCREIVQEGLTGFLIPPGDALELADRVARLAADAGLRARMGANGRRLVAAEFDESRVVQATLRVYEQAWRQLGDRVRAAAAASA
ncbi:MAG: glycosyltransferase family 1 protein [Acidobacteria bacterium]|nr:MAG: glycosyltransferase family 1 protein [Acidobacteriota bacterium]